jgi:2'-5' RNA ligase
MSVDPSLEPPRPERMHRLFFALWPSDALRSSLAPRIQALQPCGVGRPQRPDQWHLTLEFLGPVPAPRMADARAAAEAVRAAACEIRLDAVEFWRRPEVLCLVARETPPAVVELVRQLRAALADRGFEPESRPFRAHLTLARKVQHPVTVEPFEPLLWPVDAFALVESITDRAGSVYTPLVHWPIGP